MLLAALLLTNGTSLNFCFVMGKTSGPREEYWDTYIKKETTTTKATTTTATTTTTTVVTTTTSAKSLTFLN
jgi:hypothetical protein